MKSLPYDLPEGTQAQLEFLAKVTGIPKEAIRNGGERELEAIAAMIVYRHLDRHARMQAMEMIHNLPNRRLAGILVTKTLDTTFVNPQWGIWSLSNEELLADITFHARIEKFSSLIGLSFSASAAYDLYKESWKLRLTKPKHWIMLIVWGCLEFNSYELRKAQKELGNRQRLLTSEHY